MKLVNIGMGNGLYADFIMLNDEQQKKSGGYPADFLSSAFGKPGRAIWDFGDGTVDTTSLNPTHVYKEPGTYTVCLTVTDTITGQSETNCQQITVGEGQTGISAIGKENVNIHIYPNPFNIKSKVVFSLPKQTYLEFGLFDVVGHKIRGYYGNNQPSGVYSFDLMRENLRNGMYFLRMRTNMGTITKQIMIND